MDPLVLTLKKEIKLLHVVERNEGFDPVAMMEKSKRALWRIWCCWLGGEVTE